jgi:hypothetical protein
MWGFKMKKSKYLLVIISIIIPMLVLQSCFQYKSPTTVAQKQVNFIIINNSPGITGYPVTISGLMTEDSGTSLSIPVGMSATASLFIDYSPAEILRWCQENRYRSCV